MSASQIAHSLGGIVISLLPLATGDGAVDKPSAACVPVPDVPQVLTLARKALGYENLLTHPGGFQLEGTWEGRGLKGSFTMYFTPRGQFLRRIDSRVKELVAFDGLTGWGVDVTGTPRILEMDDLESAQVPVWVQTGRWLALDGLFTITLVPNETTDQRIALRLQLKSSGRDARMILDRSTGLPLLLRQPGHAGDETWEFQDYRKAEGMMLAHKLVQAHGPQSATWLVRNVRAIEASDNTYKPVLTRPDDTRFDRAAPVTVPIKRGPSGHLYVRPKVNGRDVGWFALDTGTGSGMTITAAAADTCGMESFGQVVAVGAGKPQMSVYRQGATFELGPVAISQLTYVEMPRALAKMIGNHAGVPVAGTCGYSLFSRAILVLDWKEEKLEIHDPDRYELPAGRWQPLSLNHKIPCVPCRFEDNREGLFRLDTGCPVILFHSPAVEKLKLLEGRETQPVSVGGAGGTVEGRLGTLSSFVVGGHRYDKPRALFILAKDGALAEPYTLGTFGGQFLAPFQIAFDYPHRRIAFIEK
jgi:hypothetical protein